MFKAGMQAIPEIGHQIGQARVVLWRGGHRPLVQVDGSVQVRQLPAAVKAVV